MFGLIVFGAISLSRLGVSFLPEAEFPVVSIAVDWPGAAPEVIETEIVDRLEQAVISVEGVRDITSSIRQGRATVTLQLELSRNVDSALLEVQSSVSRVRMPKDVDPPTISKQSFADNPIMWLGVSSSGRSIRDLNVYADLHLRDEFQVLPGVGEVMLGGFTERNLRLWVDNEKLKQHELTILDVQKALEMEHIETAAGIIENKQQEMNIRAMGEGLSAEEVGDILIAQRGGKPIYHPTIRLRDVARVEDGLNDIRRISHITGVPGVGLGIKKQRGANAVAVSDRVRARIAEINKTLPKDIKIQLNFDQTNFIREAVHETEFTLILSVLLTGLICYLFLGSWSSTLNVLLSVPTSIMGTFIVLYFMGLTLNNFTLLGLALAVGIVVDDAIMVLENIVRHVEMKKGRVQAAMDGAREITFAAVAATVAIVAIFLPVVFVKGIIGRFFFEFGITISSAVALSLVEAITITPMRCSQFLTVNRETRLSAITHDIFENWSRVYRKALDVALDHRVKVLLISIAFFAASMFLFYILKKEAWPPQDQSIFLIRFQTPVGSSMESTIDKLRELERYVQGRPEVVRYFAAVGGFEGGEVNTGILFLSLKPRSERKHTQQELMVEFRKDLSSVKDAKMVFIDLSTQDPGSRGRGLPVQFNIQGSSWDGLRQQTSEIVKRLGESGWAVDIDTDFKGGMPELRVIPDREKAAERGVNVDAIVRTINAAIGGVREGRFTGDGRRYDVRLRLVPQQRLQPEAILDLQVRNIYGELIPMKDLVKTEIVPALQTISRRDRQRTISISANMAKGKSQADVLAAAEEISRKVLPEGYKFSLSDSAQIFRESFAGLGLTLVLGIVVAYMVLASQFNSFLHPFSILLSLPFSISGAFLALFLTGRTLNVYSFIGIILLMGIVKKNAILLVEFTNRKRFKDGLALREAILVAAPIRLRPILMTSFATIAAAIPPALALGPGAESRIPMSVTIIGGMVISTLFTLLVVPSAYSLLARFERAKPSG